MCSWRIPRRLFLCWLTPRGSEANNCTLKVRVLLDTYLWNVVTTISALWLWELRMFSIDTVDKREDVCRVWGSHRVIMKSWGFWDITSCGMVTFSWCLGEIHRHYLHSPLVGQAIAWSRQQERYISQKLELFKRNVIFSVRPYSLAKVSNVLEKYPTSVFKVDNNPCTKK
jgi:hypothetical protein